MGVIMFTYGRLVALVLGDFQGCWWGGYENTDERDRIKR